MNKKILNKIKNYPKFYQKVWIAVSEIPKGETKSYSWAAKKIGNPKACRAVGNALNKNPFTGIIPCHRVIRKNGKIGGYSKGLKSKIHLLNKEKEKEQVLCSNQ
ncbi:MGMT family protein [bacterium]